MATDQLSLTFAALADPTRRAILARLAEQGEVTVNELAEPFPHSVQAISKHLKVLERAGLITRGRTAQLRTSRLAGAALGGGGGRGERRCARWPTGWSSAATSGRAGSTASRFASERSSERRMRMSEQQQHT